jgi:hypothetical protein
MKRFAAVVLPLLLCYSGFPAHAQKPVDARTTQKMVDRILRETSEIRGLPLKRTVQSRVQSRVGVQKMLEGLVQKQASTQQVLAAELFLRQLGLAPADFQLKSTYIAMMGEQIAGYYDTHTKTFTTAAEVDPLQLETVIAHELTHALQDQSFDLSRLEKWPAHDSDARLAMSALVEGDATLAMSHYMMRNPLRALGIMASTLRAPAATPAFTRAPRILRESVTFPYVEGLKFASNLYKQGKWSAVSKAFTRPPRSSEHILHFEKYLAYEKPTMVKVRDVSPTLGRNWTLLDHGVNGEIGLFLTLVGNLGNDKDAKSAAAGWGGDRYMVYRGPKNAVLVVQDSAWDSQFDARQWREAYARGISRRFKSKAQQRGALQVWSEGRNGVWIEQRGKRVLILEGTVGAFNPTPVFATLWR